MLISSKSEYALRALVDIAENFSDQPVSRSGISERQRIPLPYLTQVLRLLVNGGILSSNRGPAGGYVLNRDPQEISILEVVTILQGPVSPTNCANLHDSGGPCERASGCGLAGVWMQLQSASEEVLGHTSLRDIMKGKPGFDEGPAAAPDARLDCIGAPCPIPIVNISQKMRELRQGEVLEVWADDEGSKADIPAWCMGTGNEFLGHHEHGRQMKFLIRKLCD